MIGLKYTDLARERVLEAIDRYSLDEFCTLTGLSRHTVRTVEGQLRRKESYIGIVWLERAASMLGLNIAEVLLDKEELNSNYKAYVGAEIKNYAYNINRLMAKKGFDKQALASAANVSFAMVQDYVNAKTRLPHLSTLESVAEALGVELPLLFLPPQEEVIE